MTVPPAPDNGQPLHRRTFHGEGSESAEELEILSLRARLREAQAENERFAADALACRAENERLVKELDAFDGVNARSVAQLADALARVAVLEAGTELTRAQLAIVTKGMAEARAKAWGEVSAYDAELRKRVFLGPCVHGRDPYERCDEDDVAPGETPCGELSWWEAAGRVGERAIARAVAEERERCCRVVAGWVDEVSARVIATDIRGGK